LAGDKNLSVALAVGYVRNLLLATTTLADSSVLHFLFYRIWLHRCPESWELAEFLPKPKGEFA
jgi:hypothetical protein